MPRPPVLLLALLSLCMAALLPAEVMAAADIAAAAQTTPPIEDRMPEVLPSQEFRQVLARVGDDLYIGGQPTEQGLRDLRQQGVTTVINLRTHAEMNDRSIVPFDEAGLLEALGMRYIHIPSGGPETPYSAAMVERFAAALAGADGKVLLHCTVAWRASHLYSAYLYRHAGLSLDAAVAHGRAINLGQWPLEGFLGEPISFEVAD